MPRKSPFQIDIARTDVLSFVYPEGTEPYDQPIWIDADDTGKSLSPKQLLHWAKRLGLGLDRLDIGQNEVVLMCSTNHIFVPAAFFGIAGSGRIFSGCNPAYTAHETAFQIENTGAKLILVDPPLLSVVLEAADKIRFPRDRIFLFSDNENKPQQGIRDWNSILASPHEAESWQWHRMTPEESMSRIAILNYSSGTTGLPKGVMISHHNLIANVCQSLHMRKLEQPHSVDKAPPERWLGFLPLYHAYGQLWSITSAAVNRTPCYYMRSFSFEPFLKHIQNHKITHIQTAPPVLVMLDKRPETSRYNLGSLVNILCGAAPLSKELQNSVSDKLGLKIVQTWGMTELTCSGLHVPGGLDDRSGSVGHISPNAEVKLLDDDGKEVIEPGKRGEVYIRGPNVCLGYWKNESATKETFDSEGFLKTGDVAIYDDKGWYWIVDRKKELIKVKGFQVAPAELEAVLLKHDDIADAAVVALQRDHEELPRAYVVLKESAKGRVKEREIVEWTAQRVAKHKRLDGGVVFIETVPKSASGKIQRKVMREWAKKDSQDLSEIKAKL